MRPPGDATRPPLPLPAASSDRSSGSFDFAKTDATRGPQRASAPGHGRIARIDVPRQRVRGHHAAQHRHGAFSHRDPGTDPGSRPDPGVAADHDGFHPQREPRVRPVVIPRAQVSPLRDAAIRPDGDGRQVVDPDRFPDPGVGPDIESPRTLDVDARLDHDSGPDPRPEQTKEESLRAIERAEPGVEDHGVRAVPKGPLEPSRPWRVGGDKTLELHGGFRRYRPDEGIVKWP